MSWHAKPSGNALRPSPSAQWPDSPLAARGFTVAPLTVESSPSAPPSTAQPTAQDLARRAAALGFDPQGAPVAIRDEETGDDDLETDMPDDNPDSAIGRCLGRAVRPKATFEMREAAGRAQAAVALEAGSLLLVTGEAVARWWHRVPKTARPVGPRVNLTFRHMVADG